MTTISTACDISWPPDQLATSSALVKSTHVLLRFDHDERGIAVPVYQQNNALVAGPANGSPIFRHRFNWLSIDLLNHVATLKTSISGRRVWGDVRDHDTFEPRPQVQFAPEFGRQFINLDSFQCGP